MRKPAGRGSWVAIISRTFATACHYGLLAGVQYAEPFVQKEIGLVEDLLMVPVQSI